MKIVKGDLLTLADNGEFDVIIHGCNCYNNFGAGIAWIISQKYPSAWKADQDTVKGDKTKLGTYTQAQVLTKTNPVSTFTIINAYTQYGCNASENVDLFEYESFETLLHKLAQEYPNSSFGFPKIGCGLAGGNEKVIMDMIDRFSKIINGSVTVVEWVKF